MNSKEKIFFEKTNQYADKIVDRNYAKNKPPLTHLAENAVKELGFKYNSTTGTFRNNDGKTLPMKEALEITEVLDKNFKDQKTDDYIKKLDHFGIEHSQTKHPDYPKVSNQPILKNNINNKKFNETPKQTWIRLDEAEKERQQIYRRKQHYLKTWGIEDGPHNPDLRNIIRKAVNEADDEKKNNPTVNKYKVFKENQKKQLEDKKFKENFDKDYGTQSVKNRVRAKEMKNKKAGKPLHYGFTTGEQVVAESTKDEAREKLKALKAESVELEPSYIDYRLAFKEPEPRISLEEHIAQRAPREIDPPGITGLEEVKNFKNIIDITNQKFPTRARGLGPLLGEEN